MARPKLSPEEKRRRRDLYSANYREKNREKLNRNSRERYLMIKESPQRYEEWQRTNKKACLKKRYSITLDEYERMENEQDGRCKICKKIDKLHVDHCHETNKVRGLLCGRCNMGIGLFDESPQLFKWAADYVELHKTNDRKGT